MASCVARMGREFADARDAEREQSGADTKDRARHQELWGHRAEQTPKAWPASLAPTPSLGRAV